MFGETKKLRIIISMIMYSYTPNINERTSYSISHMYFDLPLNYYVMFLNINRYKTNKLQFTFKMNVLSKTIRKNVQTKIDTQCHTRNNNVLS